MSQFKSAMLAVMFVVLFISVPPSTAQERSKQRVSALMSTANIQMLRDATGRFEWRNAAGRVMSLGTAWCAIMKEDGAYSIWVTCKHVAEPEQNQEPWLVYFGRDGRIRHAPALLIKLDAKADIAVFAVEGAPRAALEPMTQAEVAAVAAGDMLASAGHVRDVFPAVVTVGWFVGQDGLGVVSTVGGWYGVSGSALVDVRTMKVIGVQYRFRDRFESDDIGAVPASEIRRALLDYLK